MPHYLLDAANDATELPSADLDNIQSVLRTTPTLVIRKRPCWLVRFWMLGTRIVGFFAAVRGWCC